MRLKLHVTAHHNWDKNNPETLFNLRNRKNAATGKYPHHDLRTSSRRWGTTKQTTSRRNITHNPGNHLVTMQVLPQKIGDQETRGRSLHGPEVLVPGRALSPRWRINRFARTVTLPKENSMSQEWITYQQVPLTRNNTTPYRAQMPERVGSPENRVDVWKNLISSEDFTHAIQVWGKYLEWIIPSFFLENF